MGKGMDGHAGEDLIVRVPCGTQVWRLASPPAALPGVEFGTDEEPAPEVVEEPPARAPIPSATRARRVIRVAADGSQAMEVKLEEPAPAPVRSPSHVRRAAR